MNKRLLLTIAFFLTLYPISERAYANQSDIPDEEISAFEQMFGQGPQEEDVYRADRLLVSATKRVVPLRKAPAIATVITDDEIRDMGARNLMDVLKTIPGLGISINEQGVRMFEVRGITTTLSEKILLMMDGHPLNTAYVGSALSYVYDDLTVENIAQVEVVRGPGSALYGANAFTAVINIITKKPSSMAGGGEVKVSGGSFGTRKMNVLGGRIFENSLQILYNLDYWKTDGPDLEISQDRLTGTPFTTTPGKAHKDFEKTDLFLKILYKNLAFQGEYLAKDRGTYAGFNYALTDGNSWHINNYWGEVSYNHTFSDILSSTVKVYYDHFEQEPKLVLMPPLPGFSEGIIGAPKLKNRTTGSEIQIDYDPFTNNHLITGLLYEKISQYDVKHIANFNPLTGAPLGQLQDISSWGNFNKDVKREIYAAYFQDEWELRDNLSLTLGTRYDHYSDFGETINPRAGLVWGITEKIDLKLLYGEAFRAPNFVELYNANNPVIAGNPDLQPETIKTYEVGFTYRFAKPYTIDLNYFHSEIGELISWDTSTSPAQYINKGGSENNGFEIVLTGEYSKSNYWNISYTYQDPKDADTKLRLPNVPYHRASLNFNHQLSQYITAHTDLLWTGTRVRSAGDPRPEMPSYMVVDLTFTARNFFKTFEIQCAFHNLFDKQYEDPDTSGMSQYIPNDFPRDGISANVNISYGF